MFKSHKITIKKPKRMHTNKMVKLNLQHKQIRNLSPNLQLESMLVEKQIKKFIKHQIKRHRINSPQL